jgi:CRP/FNR family transcriptional regulator
MSYSITEKTKLISAIPVFSGLPANAVERLASDSITREHSRGDIIFSQGDPATGFYLLTEGRVKIFKISLDGKEQILHIFSPGNLFGEAAVFSGGSFPADAMAIEKSRTLTVPQASLKEVLNENPLLAMNMLAVLSARLRQFSELIENLSLKEVPARLATYLVLMAAGTGSDTVHLDITRNQLASMLGTIPETLSRILSRMTSSNIIQVNGREIRILDHAKLSTLANGAMRL